MKYTASKAKNKRTNHSTADSKPSSNQALTTSAETGSPAKAASWSSQLRTLFGHIWVIFHDLKSILKIQQNDNSITGINDPWRRESVN